MTSPLIAVASGALLDLPTLQQELAAQATVVSGPVATPEDVALLTAEADALVVSLHRLTEAHFAALGKNVRAIGRAGVGLDTIDLDAARAYGVAVINQPSYASQEVADQAAALLLGAHRRVPQADASIRRGDWPGPADLGSIPGLSGLTLGVLGCGRIGQMVIERMSPFVASILTFDALVRPTGDKVSVAGDLPSLLAASDILTLHLPLTAETHHIIGAAELAQLPANALLVNVSRGGLVDEDALATALASGRLRGAALDVFEGEPLTSDSPLRLAPNVVLSPHIAWYSDSSGPRLARWSLLGIVEFLGSGDVRHGAVAVPAAASSSSSSSFAAASS